MKKIVFILVAAMLSIGSAFATPKFKSINNKHGKTTVTIEFSDTDLKQVTEIKDWKLYNDGEEFAVKNVNVKGDNGHTFILEFKKLTIFDDCTLSFTMNGRPVSIDIIPPERLFNPEV